MIKKQHVTKLIEWTDIRLYYVVALVNTLYKDPPGGEFNVLLKGTMWSHQIIIETSLRKLFIY